MSVPIKLSDWTMLLTADGIQTLLISKQTHAKDDLRFVIFLVEINELQTLFVA